MLVLLDTTVLIDYLRGQPAVDRVNALLARGDTPWTSAVNVEEITRGLRASETAAAESLFDGLRVLPIRQAEGSRLVNGGASSRPNGVTLSQADCLIAAAAHAVDAALATGNPRHFPMGGLEIEHWPVGE